MRSKLHFTHMLATKKENLKPMQTCFKPALFLIASRGHSFGLKKILGSIQVYEKTCLLLICSATSLNVFFNGFMVSISYFTSNLIIFML